MIRRTVHAICRAPGIHHAICLAQGRSGKWPAVRRAFLKAHPMCAATGVKADEVHHEIPFSVDPSKELDESNLVPIRTSNGAHLLIGHLGDFHSYNLDVRRDCAAFLRKVKGRP